MASPENPNWLLDCPLIDDLSAPPANGFIWAPQEFNHQSKVRPPFSTHEGYVSMGANDPFVETETFKEQGSQKRARSESSSQAGSKACREKMRRDRLNDKFLELGSILEPGKPPKLDKVAILCDATRMVTQLRADAQKLNDLNQTLQDKIKELKLRLFSSTWNPPPTEWIKLNVDASLRENYAAGVGGVLRDCKGRFLFAFGFKRMHWDCSTLEVEAVISFNKVIQEWMFEAKGIIIEGDNYNVLKFIQNTIKEGVQGG
ncbi:transcription factor ILR3-like isoform X1 [Dendrobium catenatum]|uniref:transcription factor ILR3-like isoform X1 n=1 Tax=Dendrobium catenatum TaxID=906689 RepID=UPI00109FE849|nr:transcription factor ILR3-like isoform X1 [Dendrobium catenatum]